MCHSGLALSPLGYSNFYLPFQARNVLKAKSNKFFFLQGREKRQNLQLMLYAFCPTIKL